MTPARKQKLAGEALTFLATIAKGMKITRIRELMLRSGLLESADFEAYWEATVKARDQYLSRLAKRDARPFDKYYDHWRDAALAYYLQVIREKYPDATPEPIDA